MKSMSSAYSTSSGNLASAGGLGGRRDRIKCLGEIYIHTVLTKRLLSMALTRELIQCNNCNSVERPFTKPYCASEINLFAYRK